MRGRCLSAVGAVLAIALFTLAASPCTAVLRTILENTASATLVIDAGHGGFDGGAVAARGVSRTGRSTCHVAHSVSGRSPGCSAYPAAHHPSRTTGALDYQDPGAVGARKQGRGHPRARTHRDPDRLLAGFRQHPPQQIRATRSTTAHRCFTPRTAHSESQLAEALQSAARLRLQGIRKTADSRRARPDRPGDLPHAGQLTCPAVIVECGFSVQPRRRDLRLRSPKTITKTACCLHRDQAISGTQIGHGGQPMKQKTLFLMQRLRLRKPPKWYGKCPSCGAWNTMSEFKVKPPRPPRAASTALRATARRGRPVRMDDIETGDEARFLSGIGELDRVSRRRRGARLVRARRRRARHRQIYAPAPDVSGDVPERPRAVCFRRGVAPADSSLRAGPSAHRPPASCISSRRPTWIRSFNETELMAPDILIVDSIQTVYKQRSDRRARRHDADQGMRDAV